jgi:hypothetical protein
LILAGIVSCGRWFLLDRRLIRRVAGRAGETDFPENQLMSTRQQAPIPLALSRNMPEGLKTIVANCLAHGRRRFVEVAMNFPEECLYVMDILKDVYTNDAEAKDRGLSPELQKHAGEPQI